MSKSQGVLAKSLEREARDKVLDNYLDRNSIWKCRFFRRGENRSTRRESSSSKDKNQPLTKPSYDAGERESNPGHIQTKFPELLPTR